MNFTKEDFINTQWDASDWTKEQKTNWQEFMFDLGFSWVGRGKSVGNLDATYYILHRKDIFYSYGKEAYIQCKYEDAFPDNEDMLSEKPCLFENLMDHANKYGVVLTVTHDAVEISHDDLGGLDIVVYNQEELDQVLAAIKLLQDKIN